jgi:molecular chaperone GrpE
VVRGLLPFKVREVNRRIQIPVKVKQNMKEPAKASVEEPEAREGQPAPVAERHEEAPVVTEPAAEQIDWRDMALRLQAEIENSRKLQQKLARDQIAADRERLLRGVLRVADNLERALARESHSDGLRQGVQLTYNDLVQWLKQQGVERLNVLGQPFDPALHEAVSAVPADAYGAAPQTVVEEVEAGYRLGDRLLRPARVVVAVAER